MTLTGPAHRLGLLIFLAVLAAHWAEHLAQALQVFVLDWPRPAAGGLLGLVYPHLVHSELLHLGHAIFTVAGLVLLRAPYGAWWAVAIWIQMFHLYEHQLLWTQGFFGTPLGQRVSMLQYFIPRVELHLFYNSAVLVPMLVAMYLRRWDHAK